MASGRFEISVVVLLAGLLIYCFLRMRGFKIGLLPFFIIFLLPASFLYFDVGFHLFYHRVFLIVYFIAFLIKVYLQQDKLRNILNMTTISAIAFLFVALTGLVVCIDHGLYFRYWFAFLSGVLLYLCILFDTDRLDKLEAIVFTCITTGFIWATIGLLLFIKENGSFMRADVNTMYRVGVFSGDSNYFASIIIVCMQLSFSWYIKRGGKGRLFSLLSFLTMGLALAFTYSRGAYVGFCVLLLLNVVILFMCRRKLSELVYFGRGLSILGVIIGIMAMLFVIVQPLGDRAKSIKEDETGGSHRIHIWRDMLRVSINNPVGVGLGNISVYTARHRDQYPTAGSVAHNLFLQILVETGWIGFLVYLCFLASYYSKVFYIKRISDQALLFWLLGVLISLGGMFVTQFFLSNVYDEMLFIMIALLNATLAMHTNNYRLERAHPVNPF